MVVWGLGGGLTTPHHEKLACYEILHRALELAALVNMMMNLQVPKEGRKFLD
jgi:hypothetical protein